MAFDPENANLGDLLEAARARDPVAQRLEAEMLERINRERGRVDGIARDFTREATEIVGEGSRKIAAANDAKEQARVARETRTAEAVERAAARADAAEARATEAVAREEEALRLSRRNLYVAIAAGVIGLGSLAATVLIALLD